ncbi:radiation-inducible immediate-early gene IEX-1 [Discoglossus pictus]
MCVESSKRSRHRPALSLPAPEPSCQAEPSCMSRPRPAPELSCLGRPRPLTRSSLPEVFTFDAEPQPQRKPGVRARRPRRVMYPAKVRRYLPPPETDRALRWLYVLSLVVLGQVCCEEPGPAAIITQHAPADAIITQPALGVQHAPADAIITQHAPADAIITQPALGVQHAPADAIITQHAPADAIITQTALGVQHAPADAIITQHAPAHARGAHPAAPYNKSTEMPSRAPVPAPSPMDTLTCYIHRVSCKD